MKRTILATAAFLLLLSSSTYAFPRPRHRGRIISGPELGWCTGSHRHDWVWVERHSRWECSQPVVYFEYQWTSPGHWGYPGRHRGWERPRWGGWRGPDRGRGHGRR